MAACIDGIMDEGEETAMKKLMLMICFLAVQVAIPIQADENGLGNRGVREQKLYRDECLLVAKNCPNPDYRLQERINHLRDEIDKGSSVYTPEELRVLKRKLDDSRATLDFFINEQPSQPLAY